MHAYHLSGGFSVIAESVIKRNSDISPLCLTHRDWDKISGRRFVDDIFKFKLLSENCWSLIHISPNFVTLSKGRIKNIR